METGGQEEMKAMNGAEGDFDELAIKVAEGEAPEVYPMYEGGKRIQDWTAQEPTKAPPTLHQEIAQALNRASAESPSNTPDFILATFLLGCLAAFNQAESSRQDWYVVPPKTGF